MIALFACAALATVPDLMGQGARWQGAGGGGVAVVDDGNAAFLNPAGLSGVRQPVAGLGYIAGWPRFAQPGALWWDTNRDGAIDANDAPLQFDATPPSMAGLQIVAARNIGGKFGIGLTAYIPTRNLIRFDMFEPALPNYIMYANRQQRFVAAAAVGGRILPGLSVGAGANLLAKARVRVAATVSATVSPPASSTGGGDLRDEGLDGAVTDAVVDVHDIDFSLVPAVAPVAGLQLDLGELVSALRGLRLGASYQGRVGLPLDVEIDLAANAQVTEIGDLEPFVAAAVIRATLSLFDHYVPQRVHFGIAYRRPERFFRLPRRPVDGLARPRAQRRPPAVGHHRQPPSSPSTTRPSATATTTPSPSGPPSGWRGGAEVYGPRADIEGRIRYLLPVARLGAGTAPSALVSQGPTSAFLDSRRSYVTAGLGPRAPRPLRPHRRRGALRLRVPVALARPRAAGPRRRHARRRCNGGRRDDPHCWHHPRFWRPVELHVLSGTQTPLWSGSCVGRVCGGLLSETETETETEAENGGRERATGKGQRATEARGIGQRAAERERGDGGGGGDGVRIGLGVVRGVWVGGVGASPEVRTPRRDRELRRQTSCRTTPALPTNGSPSVPRLRLRLRLPLPLRCPLPDSPRFRCPLPLARCPLPTSVLRLRLRLRLRKQTPARPPNTKALPSPGCIPLIGLAAVGPQAGRIAPTPSGHLHLGNALAFGAAWLSARAANAELLLRIEDVDRTRSRSALEEAIRADLGWLGIDWDREVWPQRQRSYDPWVALLGDRWTYRCVCTRKQVAALGGVYPGTCRDAGHAEGAVRFRLPDGPVRFVDRRFGPRTVDPTVYGDPVLVRRDGTAAYNLAVVVDDLFDGVTEVVRGADLVDYTAVQIRLWEAFGATPPTYLHAPLLLGPDGTKLSKRHGATEISALAKAGRTPRDVWRQLLPYLGIADRDHICDAVDAFRPRSGPLGPIHLPELPEAS